MSFLLTLQGLVATAFVVGLVLGFLLPQRWQTIGWGIAGLAALFGAARVAFAGEQVTAILFAALWGALGGFPGAAIGSWLHKLLKRSA